MRVLSVAHFKTTEASQRFLFKIPMCAYPSSFFSDVMLANVPNMSLIGVNEELALKLGIDPE